MSNLGSILDTLEQHFVRFCFTLPFELVDSREDQAIAEKEQKTMQGRFRIEVSRLRAGFEKRWGIASNTLLERAAQRIDAFERACFEPAGLKMGPDSSAGLRGRPPGTTLGF